MVLSIAAVLLAVLVFVHFNGSTFFAQHARAAGPPPVFPNAAAQRLEMIEAIREVNASVQASMALQRELKKLLEQGDAKIKVANLEGMTRQRDDDDK
jgi:hypothetical protein